MKIKEAFIQIYQLSRDLFVISQHFIIFFINAFSPQQNKMVSFAYDKWFICGFHLGMPYPLNSPSMCNMLRPLANTFATIINRVEDKGSPCFRPLDDLKKPNNCPFTRIEYQLFEISRHILSISNSEKPNYLSTLIRNTHDTLSYALVISNFTTTFWYFFLRLMSLMISWANSMFSVMLLL